MKTFNKTTKAKYVKRMRQHAEADEIVQGQYWENGKGCATGCLMHSSEPHKEMEEKLGIPEARDTMILNRDDRLSQLRTKQDE